jgi:secreted PhoX family phosphatase
MGDKLVVPPGYVATALAAWGEPIGIAGNMPAWRGDGSHSAADQAVQMGMHHDGIHFYPLQGSSTRGLLALNHEYTDDGLLHSGWLANWSREGAQGAGRARRGGDRGGARRDGWQMVRPVRYARRFTARHAVRVAGRLPAM